MPSVLVVDDEPALLQFVSMVLQHSGYSVFTASNGVEGLMVYSSYREEIALVLTDVQMPGMNGIEMAKRLHALNPEVKILLMSGYVPDGVEVPQGLRLLNKPFLPDKLMDAVNDILAA